MNKAKIIKISNGEEVIAEVQSVQTDSITVRDPLVINKLYDESGYTYFTIRPWFTQQFEEDCGSLNIMTNHIIAYIPVPKALLNQYYSTIKSFHEDDDNTIEPISKNPANNRMH